MKNATRIVLFSFIMMAAYSRVSAQATATANAFATIVSPLTISKLDDLNFGNVAVQSLTGGTVVLTPFGNRSTTGGVTLPVGSPGIITPANFDVFGEPGYSFAITLPVSIMLDNGSGETMLVDAFTSSPSPSGSLDVSGAAGITVGATLNVNAGQVAGVYTSIAPFDVTVNYN